MSKKNSNLAYDASSIQTLKGLEGIRKRPSMYVDDVGLAGLQTVMREPTDNSFDEALNGYGGVIEFNVDYSDPANPLFSVMDYGRGMPTGPDSNAKGRSVLEVLCDTIHAGGKFSSANYKMSGGLNGVGLKATNALSKWFRATSYREGKSHEVVYEKGVQVSKGVVVTQLEPEYAGFTGTLIEFIPDESIFVELDSLLVGKPIIEDMLRTRVFLSSKLHTDDAGVFREVSCNLNFNGEITEIKEPDGIVGLLLREIGRQKMYHDTPFFLDKSVIETYPDPDNNAVTLEQVIRYQVAVQFSIESGKQRFFCNTIEQTGGGTHANGIQSVLKVVLTEAVIAAPFIKEKDKELQFKNEDTSEFANIVLSIFHPNPIYKGQSKHILQNSSVRGIILNNTKEEFENWLAALDPASYRRILERVVSNARARNESKKMKETQVKYDLGILGLNNIGKLAEARSEDRFDCELFLCEG